MKQCGIYEEVHDLPAIPKSVEESSSQDLVYENIAHEIVLEKSEQT